MKKILTILSLFIVFAVNAQSPIYDNVRVFGYMIVDDSLQTPYIKVDSILFEDGSKMVSAKVDSSVYSDTAKYVINSDTSNYSVLAEYALKSDSSAVTYTTDTLKINTNNLLFMDPENNLYLKNQWGDYLRLGEDEVEGASIFSQYGQVRLISSFDKIRITTQGNDYDFIDDTLFAEQEAGKFKYLYAPLAEIDTVKSAKMVTDTSIVGEDTITGGITLKEAVENEVFDSIYVGEVKAGRVEADTVWFAAGGFQDSTITVGGSIDVWYHATNTWFNSVLPITSQGFGYSNDTLKCLHSAWYDGGISITFSAPTSNEIEFRGWNVTKGEEIGFKQGRTANGNTYNVNVTVFITAYVEEGDEIVFQVRNISASQPIILRHYQFKAGYLKN